MYCDALLSAGRIGHEHLAVFAWPTMRTVKQVSGPATAEAIGGQSSGTTQAACPNPPAMDIDPADIPPRPRNNRMTMEKSC